MNETTKTKTVIIVPCSDCHTLNRVEMEYLITPAKSIGEEEERKKLESEANNAGQTKPRKSEGERVRPNDSQGKPIAGKPDDPASDKPGTADNPKSKEGKTGRWIKGTTNASRSRRKE